MPDPNEKGHENAPRLHSLATHASGVEPRVPFKSTLLTASATVGGLLLGYEAGSTIGVIRSRAFIEAIEGSDTPKLTKGHIALIISVFFCGSSVGSIVGGYQAEMTGPRWTVISGSVVYSLGVLIQMMIDVGGCDALGSIVAGRVLAGFGAGAISTGAVLYLSETCPCKLRGALIGAFQWCIAIGFLVASIIVYSHDGYDGASLYRILIGLQFPWPVILGQYIPLALVSKSGLVLFFRNPGLRPKLTDGRSGNTFVLYYITPLLESTGVVDDSLLITLILAIVSVCSVPISLWAIEYFGRRQVLIAGASGMMLCHFLTAIVGVAAGLDKTHEEEGIDGVRWVAEDKPAIRAQIAMVAVFVFLFASSWGPAAWAVTGEIFPSHSRSSGVAFSIAAQQLWKLVITVAATYVIGEDHRHGQSAAFFLWGGLCLAALAYAYRFVPEAKGLTLEQVVLMLQTEGARSSANWEPDRGGGLCAEFGMMEGAGNAKLQRETQRRIMACSCRLLDERGDTMAMLFASVTGGFHIADIRNNTVNNHKYQIHDGSVHLQLYPGKARSGWGSAERAICAFGSAVAKEVSVEEHNHGHVIEWDQGPQAPHRLATIYSRLLSPFFDVVCIFLSSFPSIDAFGDYLASWVSAHATHNSKGALNIMPRLVVVVEETTGSGAPGSGHKTTIDPTKLKELLQEQTLRKAGVPVDEAFCALHVRLLSADTCVLRGRQYMKLLNFLLDQGSSARRDKRRQRTDFDARNLVDLFGQAYRCLLANSTFDPLAASRRREPIPPQSDERIGGICVLTLAHKGTPVREAIRSFERLSRRVFAKQSIWRRALNVLFHGSLYCNKAINEALTLHYGDGTLSDYSPATARGAKLVITAKGTPCKDYVLSNFNGVGDDHARDDYEHALPAPRSRGVATWEAARATSAAPGFFTPHTIDGVGTFQDGGLWQNNPLAVALSEARAIWQSMTWPDVCLSIGTGSQRNPKTQSPGLDMSRQASTSPAADCSREEQAAQPGWRWKVSLVAVFLRVIYALMDTPTMDGDKCHHYVSRGAPASDSTNARIVRLNADLGVAAPRLDDLSCMDDLRQEAIRQYQHNPQLQQTADLLISSLFYLEIIDRPARHGDHVTFQGRILCDIAPGEQLQRLIQVLQEYESKFEVNSRAITGRLSALKT
ncbi:hypothetical protein LRP88_07355 [Fusarium phalaenopsidis]